MAVPEAPMDEGDSAVLGEDDVRFAGQPSVIHPTQEPSHHKAWHSFSSGLVGLERIAACDGDVQEYLTCSANLQ